MEKYIEILQKNPLFDNIALEHFNTMFECLGVYTETFEKKDTILFAGNKIDFIGIVLAGRIRVLISDEDGNETIITDVSVGESFAEVLACAGVANSPVSITVSQDSEVLFLPYINLIQSCADSCSFHAKLIENLLKLVALKNLHLNKKIDIISKKSIREKVLAYLQYEKKGLRQFTISLNREDMASYLCTDRSALSAELSKMQRDGLIRYRKNLFEVL